MKKILTGLFMILMLTTGVSAQETKTKNVILITLDGYRWQELFGGPDPRLVQNPRYVEDTTIWKQFADEDELSSREKLMPFFWNTIALQGQLYGNRKFKNKVNCSNNQLMSYPGYSEMLVGFADPSIRSNKLMVNPNPTVLEFLNQREDFKGHVAAFSTWDAFPYIIREEETGIPVNAGTDEAIGAISIKEKWLNDNQAVLKNPHGARYDSFTFQYAFEYLKRERPRVLFIGFDETDEHGHGARYDAYLKAAHNADRMINELWQWIQSDSAYKDQTTLLITTDHGRGKGKKNWTNHRLLAPGSRHIWFAVLGPDTPPFGEMKTNEKYSQSQVAKTLAAFLGVHYQHPDPVGNVVQTMLAVPLLPEEAIAADNTPADNDQK